MESLVLILFAAVLTGCVALQLPLLLALGAGYVIFFGYGLLRGHSAGALLSMSLSGIKTVKNILILFLLIGMLTALWRVGGTIPAIVYYSAALVRPEIMVLMIFLLNCLVSFLTGTSFGTGATMGVITMTMARSMGVDPVLAGGALLSGVYFGDRCSPVSTSAMLVAGLTETDLFGNLKGMLRSALVPFLAACGVYALLGLASAPAAGGGDEVRLLFAQQFRLGWLPLLPAALVLVLAACRVNVKAAMGVSILSALGLSLWYQGAPVGQVLAGLVLGFRAEDPAVAAMMDGGGVRSMVNVAAIVCLSSCYAGIFEGTGLLDRLKGGVGRLAERTSPYACVLLTSIPAALIACNQSLAILLTHQICRDAEPDRERLALYLENSVVVVAPLVPWSIAGAVPLSSAGAPTAGILAACYLYFIPLWSLLAWQRGGKKTPDR